MTGDMAQPSVPDSKWSGLGLRVVTGALLAPPILFALYAGPPYSDVLLAALAGISAWEWARLCRGGQWDLTVSVAVASAVLSIGIAALGAPAVAVWLLAAGTMAILLIAGRSGSQADAAWASLSVAYVGPSFLAFLWLRGAGDEGFWTILWLIFVVWATDVGAYFAGRQIGGPKLWPAVSPKKTWAGLIGGMLVAAAVGAAFSYLEFGPATALALASAALAIIAQLGDLFESGLKRRFGVKDSSALIPGHGGLLDRVDGLISVTLAYAAYRFLVAGA